MHTDRVVRLNPKTGEILAFPLRELETFAVLP